MPDGIYLRKFSGIQSGYEGGTAWFWRKLTHYAGIFEQSLPLTNVDTSVLCSLRVSSGRPIGGYGLEFIINGQSICNSACRFDSWTTFTADGEDKPRFRIEFTDESGTRTSYAEMEDIEVRYRKRLDMAGLDELWIPSVGGNEIVGYRLEGISGKTFLLRVPEDESKMSIVAVLNGGEDSYTWYDTAGLGVRYFAARESSIEDVQSFRTVFRRMDVGKELTKPRRPGNTADLVIIAPEDFVDEGVRLAEHKESIGRFTHARVVKNDDIYREFSGGRADPSAVRNFLAYASRHWQIAPEYVIFLGNGHWDYKQYTTREPIHVLTYQYRDKCIEDFFVTIDPNENGSRNSSMPDLFIGRIPSRSVSETKAVVDKIIEYEGEGADWGAWRNRVLMVADDDQQGPDLDRIVLSSPHHSSSEEVESAILTRRPSADIDRLYLYEYPWNEFWEKPQAKQALIDKLNAGVGFVNFFGHGSDVLWADEHIFKVETIGALRQDSKRYSVFTSFSCSVGRFDIPDHTSLSDALVTSEGRGAIASIASSRKAYAGANTRLAVAFYDTLFAESGFRSLGVAYARAKAELGGDENKKAYCLLGDPTLRCGPFSDSVALEFFAGEEEKPLDTLKALQRVRIRGKVIRNSVLNPNFGTEQEPAWVEIVMSNPPRKDVSRKDGSSREVTYDLPGLEIYRSGPVKIRNGQFELDALMPKRVIYDNPNGELRAYAYSDVRLAGGYKSGYVFHGTAPFVAEDTVGPSIRVRPLYGTAGNWNSKWNTSASFDDKIVCAFPVNLEMVVADESGIDLTSNAPGEGVTYSIPGEIPVRNVLQSEMKIEPNADGLYEGTAQIRLDRRELEPGIYTLHVSAQDLIGMVSTKSIQLEVTDSVESDFRLGHVFNYPNPVRMGSKTKFFLFHSGTGDDDYFNYLDQVQARIKIYTLSGKPVRIIENASNEQEWDCTDQFGNRLSPNTYLYKVEAWMPLRPDTNAESEIRKLVIHPPR